MVTQGSMTKQRFQHFTRQTKVSDSDYQHVKSSGSAPVQLALNITLNAKATACYIPCQLS